MTLTTVSLTAAFAHQLQEQDALIEKLTDAQFPLVGQAFNQAVAALDLVEKIALEPGDRVPGAAAVFWHYGLREPTAFLNTIAYNPTSIGDGENFLEIRPHEKIHGLQLHKTPIAHAIIANKNTRVILNPEDALALGERLEEDAFLKGRWIQALHRHAGDRANLDLARPIYNDPRRPGILSPYLRDLYHESCLNSWEHFVNFSHAQGTLRAYTICRAEPADFWLVGTSFGQNIFGREPRTNLIDHHRLSERSAFRLTRLQRALGYGRREALPTFTEAQRAIGQTAATALAASLGRQIAGPA